MIPSLPLLVVLSGGVLRSAAGSSADSLDGFTTPEPDLADSWDFNSTSPDLSTSQDIFTTPGSDLPASIEVVTSSGLQLGTSPSPLATNFDPNTTSLDPSVDSYALNSTSEFSTARSDVDATSPSIGSMLMDILVDACLEGAGQNIADQLKNGRNRSTEEIKTVVLETSSETAKGQQRLEQQITLLQAKHQEQMAAVQAQHRQQIVAVQNQRQQEIDAINTHHQEQMTALREYIVAFQNQRQQEMDAINTHHQEQMTALRDHLTSDQQRLQQQLTELHDQHQELATDLRNELATLQDQSTSDQLHLLEQLSTMREQLTSDQQKRFSDLHIQLKSIQNNMASSAPKGCPSGWSHRGDSCYMVPALKASWNTARQECSTFDRRAQLASVHRDNLRHVTAMVSASGDSHWIGLSRRAGSRSSWSWTDGSPLDFTNWRRGEPNNGGLFGGAEYCALMFQSGTWNDEECFYDKKFICQISLR